MNGASRDEPPGVHATEALPLLIEWAAGRKNTSSPESRPRESDKPQAEGAPPANAQANRKQ